MAKHISILFLILIFSQQCKTPSVKLTSQADPDIVLINIEDGDRDFLGKLLLKIDSLKPIVIGIDIFFPEQKDRKQDSTLIDALKKVKNDILVYSINENGKYSGSHQSFTSLATNVGFLEYEKTFNLISNMTPVPRIDGKVHVSFALKIIHHWKPDFNSKIKVNQRIPINYTRTLKQFLHLDGSFLLETNINNFDLKNKVILVGYIGPKQEDKHFTPLRLVNEDHNHDEPDTYGLVIIANQIRTILEYGK
ncbi:MAG: CHASE2 domain-containing protein [Chitinophagaceae bacterium]|nr:CHASE2 domain-containing protein [Chitinophagaceae bacterium]